MIRERAVTLITSDGVHIEARMARPDHPRGGIVLCHPHPLYGGDMDNPVVTRLAEVCTQLGFAALRLNFRGVGRSTGAHSGGAAEQLDVLAAVAHLAGDLDADLPLVLAGYSFGALVVAAVAAGGGAPARDPAGLILVGPPLGMAGEQAFARLADRPEPLLIVVGGQDEYCPPAALQTLAARLPHADVRVIDGATHFFFGKLFPLGEAVAAWVSALKPRQAGRGRSAG